MSTELIDNLLSILLLYITDVFSFYYDAFDLLETCDLYNCEELRVTFFLLQVLRANCLDLLLS